MPVSPVQLRAHRLSKNNASGCSAFCGKAVSSVGSYWVLSLWAQLWEHFWGFFGSSTLCTPVLSTLAENLSLYMGQKGPFTCEHRTLHSLTPPVLPSLGLCFRLTSDPGVNLPLKLFFAHYLSQADHNNLWQIPSPYCMLESNFWNKHWQALSELWVSQQNFTRTCTLGSLILVGKCLGVWSASVVFQSRYLFPLTVNHYFYFCALEEKHFKYL